MPRYDFRCQDCGAEREATVDYAQSRTLELFCVSCGGAMTAAPVLAVTVIRPHASGGSGQPGGKACGHSHACRCAVRLDRPNPFRPEGLVAARNREDA
jgi:hypothetical protein